MPARAFALALLILAHAVPASAIGYARYGSLNWRFDDIVVKNEQGRLRRTQWYQGYDLNLLGPIASPAVGEFKAAGEYSDGADVNQAVNYLSPRQKTMGGRVSADLFGRWVRRYLRLSPNYSNRVTQRPDADAGEARNSSWGFNSGLSLKRLPKLNFSRQQSRVENRGGVNPTRQDTTVQRESLSHGVGSVLMRYDHETQSVEERLGTPATNRTDQKRGSFESNLYGFKRVPLQSLSWRLDWLRFSSNELTSSDQLTNFLNLRTNTFDTGSWRSSLNYGNNFQRDLLAGISTLSHNAFLDSTRAVSRGNLTNSFQTLHSMASVSSLGLSDGLFAALSFASGTVTSHSGCTGGWTQSTSGQSSVRENLNTKLTFRARRGWTAFLEGQANGNHPVKGSAVNTRNYRAGAGGTFGAPLRGTATARLDRTYAKDIRAGTQSMSDQLSIAYNAVPLDRLYFSGTYSLGFVRNTPGGSSASRSLSGSLTYLFNSGLRVAVDASQSGTARSASAGANYQIGRTEMEVRYEQRELSTFSAFSHLRASLTRRF